MIGTFDQSRGAVSSEIEAERAVFSGVDLDAFRTSGSLSGIVVVARDVEIHPRPNKEAHPTTTSLLFGGVVFLRRRLIVVRAHGVSVVVAGWPWSFTSKSAARRS